MSTAEIIHAPQAQVLQMPPPVTPIQILSSAVAQGAPIDTIERLAKMHREMVEYDAKVAYSDAMQRAQSKMRPVSADAINPQTRSNYASYAQLDRALRPIYSAEGFSLSFNTADSPLPEHVRVLCDVSCGGYIRSYQIDMPADGKGAKGGDVMTKTHAIGAAVTYGMRYLLKMIFNVAIGEDDTDGNMPEAPTQQDPIRNAKTLEELQKVYFSMYRAAESAGDQKAMSAIIAAKDARKKELQNASR